jgi:ATP-binding cassette subfamily A (ABC1) protein 5
LKCIGSTQHLKNRFGRGYQLDISTDQPSLEDALKLFVCQTFEGAQLLEVHNGRLKFLLPRQEGQVLTLSSAFDTIEKHKHQLSINNYSLSQATLESIFVDIARTQEIRRLKEEGHLSPDFEEDQMKSLQEQKDHIEKLKLAQTEKQQAQV